MHEYTIMHEVPWSWVLSSQSQFLPKNCSVGYKLFFFFVHNFFWLKIAVNIYFISIVHFSIKKKKLDIS